MPLAWWSTKMDFKHNCPSLTFACVSSNNGVLSSILNYTFVIKDKTAGSTPQPLPNRAGFPPPPHRQETHRRLSGFKFQFQATSLNKYLVIFVAWRFNVICRTNTTASSRSKHHTCHPASQFMSECRFKCTWRMNASLRAQANMKILDKNKSIDNK